MLSVELTHLADVLDAAKQAKNISTLARKYSSTITNAIWDTTVSISQAPISSTALSSPACARNFQLVNNIFAYETNGEKS